MDELLTEEEVLCLLDGYRSVINTDEGLLKFAETVQKAQIGKRWRRVFRRFASPPSATQTMRMEREIIEGVKKDGNV